jgi:hypothetical protein
MTEIDLVDWTIQEAQQLKNERCQPSDLDGGPSLDRLLAVLEPDPVGATNSEEPVVRITSAPSMQMAVEEPTSTSGQAVAVPEPDAASDLSAVAQTASWTSAEARAEEPKSALLMAIVAPDTDRSRQLRDLSGLGSSTRDFWAFRLLVDHARLPRISPNDFGSAALSLARASVGATPRVGKNPRIARRARSTFAPCSTQGFVEFHLLRGPEAEDHTLYARSTYVSPRSLTVYSDNGWTGLPTADWGG